MKPINIVNSIAIGNIAISLTIVTLFTPHVRAQQPDDVTFSAVSIRVGNDSAYDVHPHLQPVTAWWNRLRLGGHSLSSCLERLTRPTVECKEGLGITTLRVQDGHLSVGPVAEGGQVYVESPSGAVRFGQGPQFEYPDHVITDGWTWTPDIAVAGKSGIGMLKFEYPLFACPSGVGYLDIIAQLPSLRKYTYGHCAPFEIITSRLKERIIEWDHIRPDEANDTRPITNSDDMDPVTTPYATESTSISSLNNPSLFDSNTQSTATGSIPTSLVTRPVIMVNHTKPITKYSATESSPNFYATGSITTSHATIPVIKSVTTASTTTTSATQLIMTLDTSGPMSPVNMSSNFRGPA